MEELELEFIANYLRAAILHVNSKLNNPTTTKYPDYISGLNFIKKHIEKALSQIDWLVEYEAGKHD